MQSLWLRRLSPSVKAKVAEIPDDNWAGAGHVMKSLADALGIPDLAHPDEPISEATDLSAEQFCKAIVDSPQYRESIQRRILFDNLPPAVECRLLDHAWGTPSKRIELTGKDGGSIEVTRVERVVVYPKEQDQLPAGETIDAETIEVTH